MGTNSINQVQGGNIARPSDLNQYFDAMTQEIAPRDEQGNPLDKGANLGTEVLKYDKIYAQQVEISGNIKRNGTLVKKVYTASANWTCPEGVFEATVLCAGAGGQGIGSQAVPISPSGAGGATIIAKILLNPGESYNATISSGNASFGNDLNNTISATKGQDGSASASEGLGGTFSFGSENILLFGKDGGFASFVDAGEGVRSSGIFYSDGVVTNGRGGGGGYQKGGNRVNTTSLPNIQIAGGGGGGYTEGQAGSGATGGAGGAAGIEVTYWLPEGVVDPNEI